MVHTNSQHQNKTTDQTKTQPHHRFHHSNPFKFFLFSKKLTNQNAVPRGMSGGSLNLTTVDHFFLYPQIRKNQQLQQFAPSKILDHILRFLDHNFRLDLNFMFWPYLKSEFEKLIYNRRRTDAFLNSNIWILHIIYNFNLLMLIIN